MLLWQLLLSKQACRQAAQGGDGGREKMSKFCLFALQEYQAAPANVKTWYAIGLLHTGSGTCNLRRRLKDNTAVCLSAWRQLSPPRSPGHKALGAFKSTHYSPRSHNQPLPTKDSSSIRLLLLDNPLHHRILQEPSFLSGFYRKDLIVLQTGLLNGRGLSGLWLGKGQNSLCVSSLKSVHVNTGQTEQKNTIQSG